MSESQKHALDEWGEAQKPPLKRAGIAQLLRVSEPYLSQVIKGRKGLTLTRALEWSEITGIPVETFKQPQAAE